MEALAIGLDLGTSGVLFVTTDGPQPNPARGVHSFCHALPGTWHQMAVLLAPRLARFRRAWAPLRALAQDP